MTYVLLVQAIPCRIDSHVGRHGRPFEKEDLYRTPHIDSGSQIVVVLMLLYNKPTLLVVGQET